MRKLREEYARVARMSSTLGSRREGYFHFSILRSFQASSFFPSKGRPGLVPYYARHPVYMLLPSLLGFLKGATWLVPHRLCRTTTVCSWGFHERMGPSYWPPLTSP